MPLKTARKITLAVGAAAALVVATAIVGVAGTRRLVHDAERVAHTHEVRTALRDVSSHVGGAKADIRGFMLTADSAYVVRYRANIGATERAFAVLRRLVADNPAQERRVDAVGVVLDARKAAFARTFELARSGARTPAEVAARLAIGEMLTARMDSILAAADVDEQALLVERSARQARSELFVNLVSAALVLTATLLVMVLGRSIRRDLLGRARAEAELRASEAKFAGILAIAADAVVTVDEQQKIVHFNHGAEEIFGYAAAEAIGQPLELLLPRRHQRTHHAQVAQFAAGPEVARRMGERGQVFGRRKDGEEFPAEASISKLETPGGWLFTAVLRDVTERRRMERHEHALAIAGGQLAESLDYEAAVATAASLPVPLVGAWCVLDLVEEPEGSEPVLRRITSSHPDEGVHAALRAWEAEGLDWDSPDVAIDVLRTRQPLRVDAVTPDWIEAHVLGPRQAAVAEAIGMHSLLVVPLLTRDRVLGTWTIGSSAQHVFDEHDEALAVALAERATLALENARLFRQAQRATAARDQALSVVSHDLRNPLSAVSMLAHRLVTDSPGEEERRTIGTHIRSAVEWMHRLMQDLLDAASIEAGGLSVELEPHAVHQLVEATVAMFAERADAQRVTLAAEVSTALPRVQADAARVVQVLGNLVGNALKFTPAGGRITIGAHAEGDEVVLWVRDSGVGIPANELPHVFDRYWHARRGTAARGTGLGLAIARGIVERHGGRIWVESTLGEGSTFFFTLPTVAVARPPAAPSVAEPAESAG